MYLFGDFAYLLFSANVAYYGAHLSLQTYAHIYAFMFDYKQTKRCTSH